MTPKSKPPAGYSGKPAWQKIGIRSGTNLLVVNRPGDYARLVGGPPPGVRFLAPAKASEADVIHLFASNRRDLDRVLGSLAPALRPGASLWISWPKGASKIQTDLDEAIVRELGLATGLVDTKVCAVDGTWSGLKFMHRTKSKPKAAPPPRP